MHVIHEGSCWITANDCPPVLAVAGDVVVVVSDRCHTIASDPDFAAVPYRDVVDDHGLDRTSMGGRIRIPGDGPVTRMLCGGYRVDGEFHHPVLDRIPPVLHLRSTATSDLRALTDLLADEISTRAAGAATVIDRLVDALFIRVLRNWAAVDPTRARWIASLSDTAVADALAMMHAEPAAPWTVEGLAEAVGCSCSSFAQHFTQHVGEPPLAYLTRWRMELAARQLRDLDDDVATVGRSVGYDSAFAFSRAFRRIRGEAPTHYRSRWRPTNSLARRAG